MERFEINFFEVSLISQPVEKIVSSFRDDSACCSRLATAIVEAVPLLVERVLSKCSIMPAPNTAIVVRNCEKIVNQRIFFLLLAKDKGLHVKIF